MLTRPRGRLDGATPRRTPPAFVGWLLALALLVQPAAARADASPEHELEELDEAIARSPSNATLLLERSVILVELRRYDDAMATLARAEVLARGDARVPVFRASVDLARGRPESARAALDAHVRRWPDDRAALLLHATACEALDDVDEAIDDLEAALALAYDDELALRTSRLLRARGRRDAAARLVLAGAAHEPAHPALLVEAIQVLRERRDFDGALVLVDRLARGASVTTRMDLLRGAVLRQAGQERQAIEAYRRALAQANSTLGRRVSAAALVERARARMGLRDFENATIDLRAAQSLAPRLPEVAALLDASTARRSEP